LYNKIFKNDQISVGGPVQIKVPVNFQTIKMAYKPNAKDEDEQNEKEIEDREENDGQDYEEIIQSAKKESENIIKAAEIEAQRIIDEADKEAVERIKVAEDEARERGFEKGYKESKSTYEDLLSEAEFIKEHATVEYSEVMAGIEKDAIELIIDVAKKVIGEEVTLNKEHIVHLVGEALGKSSNRDNITVKVSDKDYDYVLENKDTLLSSVEGIGNLEIIKDLALNQGDCIVETSYGSIDGGVQTKLRKIEETFLQMISSTG